eukprot:20477-Heterococcus_DN1.PRE.1
MLFQRQIKCRRHVQAISEKAARTCAARGSRCERRQIPWELCCCFRGPQARPFVMSTVLLNLKALLRKQQRWAKLRKL